MVSAEEDGIAFIVSMCFCDFLCLGKLRFDTEHPHSHRVGSLFRFLMDSMLA
jgi:hypothetical protein